MAGRDFGTDLTNILDEYSLEVQRAAKESAKSAAEQTVKELKKISPKGEGRRKYASGWTSKKLDSGAAGSGYVVYNGKMPGLTSPLEFGHVARNQFGTWGRVSGINHITRASEDGIKIFEDEIRSRL